MSAVSDTSFLEFHPHTHCTHGTHGTLCHGHRADADSRRAGAGAGGHRVGPMSRSQRPANERATGDAATNTSKSDIHEKGRGTGLEMTTLSLSSSRDYRTGASIAASVLATSRQHSVQRTVWRGQVFPCLFSRAPRDGARARLSLHRLNGRGQRGASRGGRSTRLSSLASLDTR